MSDSTNAICLAMLAVPIEHKDRSMPVLVVELENAEFTEDITTSIIEKVTGIDRIFQTDAATQTRVYLAFSGKESFVLTGTAIATAIEVVQVVTESLGWATLPYIPWRFVTTEQEDALGYHPMRARGSNFV